MSGNNHEIVQPGLQLRLCSLPEPWAREHADACLELLTEEERQRLQRLPGERGRVYLLGRALLREELSRRSGIAAQELKLARDARGRPFLRDSPLAFSLSYGPRWVALLSAGDGRDGLGVDIEESSRLRRDPLRLAVRLFTAEEVDWLASRAVEERRDAFLRIWTVKEAWCKASGRALADMLPGPGVVTAARQESGVLQPVVPGAAGVGFRLLRPAPGVALALCRLGSAGLEAPPLRFGLPLRARAAPEKWGYTGNRASV